jgi:invasion protein IalB
MKQSTAIALLGAAAAAVVVVIGVIFLWPGGGQQQAQQGPPPLPEGTRNFGSWALACDTDQQNVKRCGLLMRVLDQQTRRMVLSVTLTRGPRGNPVFAIVTPPSVTTASNLTIQPWTVNQGAGQNAASGQAVTAPFNSCTPQRCIVFILLSEMLAKEIQASTHLRIQYVAGNGRPVNYTLPAAGFGPGYTAWQADYPAPAAPAAAPAPAGAAPAAPAAAPAAPAGGGRGAAAPAAPAAPAAAAPAAPATPAP